MLLFLLISRNFDLVGSAPQPNWLTHWPPLAAQCLRNTCKHRPPERSTCRLWELHPGSSNTTKQFYFHFDLHTHTHTHLCIVWNIIWQCRTHTYVWQSNNTNTGDAMFPCKKWKHPGRSLINNIFVPTPSFRQVIAKESRMAFVRPVVCPLGILISYIYIYTCRDI